MPKLKISDHALVRYCERVLGLDRAAVSQAIAGAIGDATEGRYNLPGQDIVAVVQNGVVVTFVPLCYRGNVFLKPAKRPKAARPMLPEPEDWRKI